MAFVISHKMFILYIKRTDLEPIWRDSHTRGCEFESWILGSWRRIKSPFDRSVLRKLLRSR